MNTQETETTTTAPIEQKISKTKVNYSAGWQRMGYNPRSWGLNPASTPLPYLCDSGIQILARWRGTKAAISLYVRRDEKLGIKVSFLQSGKSLTVRLSQVDVPPYHTISEVMERASLHGYLRLRQPATERDIDEERVDAQVIQPEIPEMAEAI